MNKQSLNTLFTELIQASGTTYANAYSATIIKAGLAEYYYLWLATEKPLTKMRSTKLTSNEGFKGNQNAAI